MFDPTSRYYNLEQAGYTGPNGREIRYVRRRFCPRAEALPLLVEVTLNDGDRLDRLTARTIGDPLQFWQVCDANNALNPADMMAEPGRRVRVPVPQVPS